MELMEKSKNLEKDFTLFWNEFLIRLIIINIKALYA